MQIPQLPSKSTESVYQGMDPRNLHFINKIPQMITMPREVGEFPDLHWAAESSHLLYIRDPISTQQSQSSHNSALLYFILKTREIIYCDKKNKKPNCISSFYLS